MIKPWEPQAAKAAHDTFLLRTSGRQHGTCLAVLRRSDASGAELWVLSTSASRALLLKLIHKHQGKSLMISLDLLGHSSPVGLVTPRFWAGSSSSAGATMSYTCFTEHYNNTTLQIICWGNRNRLQMFQEPVSRREGESHSRSTSWNLAEAGIALGSALGSSLWLETGNHFLLPQEQVEEMEILGISLIIDAYKINQHWTWILHKSLTLLG